MFQLNQVMLLYIIFIYILFFKHIFKITLFCIYILYIFLNIKDNSRASRFSLSADDVLLIDYDCVCNSPYKWLEFNSTTKLRDDLNLQEDYNIFLVYILSKYFAPEPHWNFNIKINGNIKTKIWNSDSKQQLLYAAKYWIIENLLDTYSNDFDAFDSRINKWRSDDALKHKSFKKWLTTYLSNESKLIDSIMEPYLNDNFNNNSMLGTVVL